jgi:hypothetical protein
VLKFLDRQPAVLADVHAASLATNVAVDVSGEVAVVGAVVIDDPSFLVTWRAYDPVGSGTTSRRNSSRSTASRRTTAGMLPGRCSAAMMLSQLDKAAGQTGGAEYAAG